MDKIYKIIWRDSNFYHHQNGLDFKYDITIIDSVGFLISEDIEKVVISRDYMLNKKDCRGVIAIPRENIKEIKEIK